MVDEDTVLATLVGPNERYKALVESKFRTEFLDLTVSDVSTDTTYREFLDLYSAGSPAVRNILSRWAAYYELEVFFDDEAMEHTAGPNHDRRPTFLSGDRKTRSPSDTAASRGEGMIGMSALPAFYFDPTSDGRVKKALIPSETNEDRFPRGRFHLSLAKVIEKKEGVAISIQEEFGYALKQSYGGFVRIQNDSLQPLPGCIASRNGMTQLDGWFYCQVHDRDIVVGDIEFKANYYSTVEGIPQAYTYSISIALNLRRLGLDSEKVIVPVMVATGNLVQFGCIYMQDDFPMPLTLSGVIDTCAAEGRRLAHAYMLKVKQQVGLLKNELVKVRRGLIWDDSFDDFPSALPIPNSIYPKFGYATVGWHPNDPDLSVRHIFETLERLWNTPAWKYVCPPLGLSTRTFQKDQPLALSTSRGALLFEDLEELGFRNHPPEHNHAQEYVQTLATAVAAIHGQGVVHADLYPSNIFWLKEGGSAMKIRIIDWDTSFAVSEFVPDHIQQMWSTSVKWKPYIENGRQAVGLDDFMIQAFRYASGSPSIWDIFSSSKDSNESFRAIQKSFYNASQAESPASGD